MQWKFTYVTSLLIVRDVLVVREGYKAVMTCQELTTAGAKLIGNLGHRVQKGGCSSPRQSIYTYNCMTHSRNQLGNGATMSTVS